MSIPCFHSAPLRAALTVPLRRITGRILPLVAVCILLVSCGGAATEWIAEGNRYFEANEVGEAVRYYNEAIKAEPALATAYYNRGIARARLGDYRRGADDYTKAIELNPLFINAYFNRAYVYSLLGEQEKAIGDYDRVIELDPGRSMAYSNRCRLKGLLGLGDEAIRDCNDALDLDPKNVLAYSGRGYVHGCLFGDYEKAMADFNAALVLEPGNGAVYKSRGFVNLKFDRSRDAVDDFSTAMGLIRGMDAESYFGRGLALEKLGSAEMAMDDLKKAAELDHREARAYLRGRRAGWKQD